MTKYLRGLLLLAAIGPLAGLRAQEASPSTDDPWAAFHGCWTPVENQSLGAPPVTCVFPAAGTAFGAEIVTVRGGQTLRHITLVADGTRIPIEADECTGWESASFAEGGTRVYLTGELRCGSRPVQRTSGLYGITPAGEWLEVTGTLTGEERQLRTERSRLISWMDLPDQIRADMEPLVAPASVARGLAARALRLEDVMDVSRRVDVGVAEVWMTEVAISQPNQVVVTKSDLLRLSDAEVPTRVIDMLVALGNPQKFRVSVSTLGASAEEVVAERMAGGGMDNSFSQRQMMCDPFNQFNPWHVGFQPSPMWWVGAMPGFYGAMPMQCAGFNNFAFDSRFGLFGWARAGQYPGFFPGYGGIPVVVTVGNGAVPPPRTGRVVRGRGYTSGQPSAPSPSTRVNGTAESGRAVREATRTMNGGRAASPPRTSSGSTSSRGSSAGSSSGSSSGSSGRTAKPRTP